MPRSVANNDKDVKFADYARHAPDSTVHHWIWPEDRVVPKWRTVDGKWLCVNLKHTRYYQSLQDYPMKDYAWIHAASFDPPHCGDGLQDKGELCDGWNHADCDGW